MELRAFLQVLGRKWWIILPTFLITLIATVWFTRQQPPTYQSTATLVVRLGTSFTSDKDLLAALNTVSSRSEIATTYAEVANSHLIKNRAKQAAAAELGLTLDQMDGLSAESKVVPGTNVLRITGQGLHPATVRAFTDAVGAETAAYVSQLYETYELVPLDRAIERRTPVAPNWPMNLLLGTLSGLLLGGGLALLASYLQIPTPASTGLVLFDEETGLYDRRYFRLRLQQEISRSQRNGYALSVVLFRVTCHELGSRQADETCRQALAEVAALLARHLRQEDIVARWDETAYVLLLPDTPEEQAERVMGRLRAQIEINWPAPGLAMVPALHSVWGVAAYSEGIEADGLLAQAAYALARAESLPYEPSVLLSNNNGAYPAVVQGSLSSQP